MKLLWALRRGGATAIAAIEPPKPPPAPADKERAVSVVPELLAKSVSTIGSSSAPTPGKASSRYGSNRSLRRLESGFAFSVHEASEVRVMHGAGLKSLGILYPELQMRATTRAIQAVIKLKALQHKSRQRLQSDPPAADDASSPARDGSPTRSALRLADGPSAPKREWHF
mmetsp:Transcript_46221/g.121838  ORF Transcript_46221/g.121838 Transcript_46221/m.121838 type:complete len:170 (+) Transcript_46221:2-511(+)